MLLNIDAVIYFLSRLIQDCPLAALREDISVATDNPHVVNLSCSMNKPLYMECKLYLVSKVHLGDKTESSTQLLFASYPLIPLQMFLAIHLGRSLLLVLLMVAQKRPKSSSQIQQTQ